MESSRNFPIIGKMPKPFSNDWKSERESIRDSDYGPRGCGAPYVVGRRAVSRGIRWCAWHDNCFPELPVGTVNEADAVTAREIYIMTQPFETQLHLSEALTELSRETFIQPQGRVFEVTGLTVKSIGPQASIGDRVLVECSTGKEKKQVPCEVVGFRDRFCVGDAV